MAKTATKSKGGKGKLTTRRVTSVADRKSGGEFLTLGSIGEAFQGIALFIPDPALEDNPGYYEYFEHYTKATGYVPCAGPEQCLFCKTGDRPTTKAKTVWLVTHEGRMKGGELPELDTPTVKIFNFNWSIIQQFYDDLSEGEAVLGMAYRLKRLDDRGKYSIKHLSKSDLTKTELKKVLKETEMPDLGAITDGKLRKVYEELDASEILEDDDEEVTTDDDDEPRAKKGTKSSGKKGKAKEEEPDEDDESSTGYEDQEATITSVSKKNSTLTVTFEDEDEDDVEVVLFLTDEDVADIADFKKGMEVVFSSDPDEDDDQILSALAEKGEDEEEEGGEAGGALEDVTAEVKSVSKKNNTLTVTFEDDDEDEVEVVLFLTDDQDIADFKKGMSVTFTAEMDEEEDYVVSDIEEASETEEESEEESELPDKIEGVFEIVSVDADDDTLDVKNDEYEFTLYFLDEGSASDVDWEVYEEGMSVKLKAAKDDEGDMVATGYVPKPEKAKGGKGDKKSSGKKGGKKSGKK